MKAFLFAVLLLFFVLFLQAMPPVTPADSLMRELRKSQPDTNRVKILLDLSYFYTCRYHEKTSDLDTAILFSKQAASLSRNLQFHKGEGNSYLMTSKALRKKGELQLGRKFAARAMDIFVKYDYLSMAGSVYNEMTRYYSNAGTDLSTKIRLNEQALTYFVQAGEKRKEADVLKEQGDLYQLQENYQQSLLKLHLALALYRSIHHPDLQGVYDLMGFVSTKIGDYKSGLAYGLQAVKIAYLRADTGLNMCTYYNRLGLTYQALGQYAQAHWYFKESLAIAQKHKHIPSIVYLSGNISSIMVNSGKSQEALHFLNEVAHTYPPSDFESRIILSASFMNVYRNLQQYSRAQPYYKQVLELCEKNGAGSPGMVATYQSVIEFLLASRQYEQARKYLAINHALCLKQDALAAFASNHLQWFRLDSTMGNFPSAIAHFQKYVVIRDSLLTESKNYQMAQLEIEYQTDKKDQNIKLKEKSIELLTQQGRLQQQQLQQARMIRNGTIAGAMMLILLMGLGYNRYRLKQESNQLLEAKQSEINEKNNSLQAVIQEKEELLGEKEWMLKEIHHRVRNNLQIVISLLNSQAGYLSDNVALSTIKESQHRVQAMAFIHQKLYQSEKVARVEMASYINEMVVYLRDSYNPVPPIEFNLSVDPLELDVTLAVPLGLIINEALTNSLKYAFPEGRTGKIILRLQALPNASYQLILADDGIGLPGGYQPSSSRSLGMTLLHGLSGQLGATLEITGSSGVTIQLLFREEPPNSIYY